jgi:hypothetical protein
LTPQVQDFSAHDVENKVRYSLGRFSEFSAHVVPNRGVLILLASACLSLDKLSENRLAAVCFAASFGTITVMLLGKPNRIWLHRLDYCFESVSISFASAHQITASAGVFDGSWFA